MDNLLLIPKKICIRLIQRLPNNPIMELYYMIDFLYHLFTNRLIN
jgi:hypothetical protein